MFVFFRSVVFGFAVVSVLGVTSASASGSTSNVVLSVFSETLDGDFTAVDVAKIAVDVVAEAVSVPVAIAGAGALGATASTGTAISALSGAAAVSATSAVIGTPAAGALGAATGIVLAPAVVGGVIIMGAGALVAYGFNALIFDED